MKKCILFLMFLCCISPLLGAQRLDKRKIAEAIVQSQLEATSDRFTYQSISGEESRAMRKIGCHGPFQLVAKGLSPHTRFGLFASNLNNLHNPLFCVSGYINEDGEAIINKQREEIPLSGMLLTVGAVLPGEPIYYYLVTKDKRIYLATSIIPEPIECTGMGGQTVSMELLSWQRNKYLVHGKNFSPHETLYIKTNCNENPEVIKVTASEQGTFSFLLERKEEGLKYQQEFLQIAASGQAAPIALHYEWGLPDKILKKINLK